MPNIKSAIKWTRRSTKRREANLDVKTRLKTLYKTAASSSDPAVVHSVESAFDKAAKRGIIHPNKAARKRSRLARAAAKNLATAAPAGTKKRKTSTHKTSTKKAAK